MSLYSEMLRAALDQEPSAGERSIVDLVGDLLSRRGVVLAAASGSRASEAADRVGDTLAYDLALARLCDRLAIDHGLAGEGPVPVLRQRAEVRLAARLPLVADPLGAAIRVDPREERLK